MMLEEAFVVRCKWYRLCYKDYYDAFRFIASFPLVNNLINNEVLIFILTYGTLTYLHFSQKLN